MHTNQVFEEQADVFLDPDSTKTDVTVAGEKAIVTIYKGMLGDILDFLKLQHFLNKVGSSTSHVKPETLPQLQQLPSYTAYVCTCKCSSGWGMVTI